MRVVFDARMVTWSGIGTYSLSLLRALAGRSDEYGLALSVLYARRDLFLLDLPELKALEFLPTRRHPWSPSGGVEAGLAGRNKGAVYHAPHVTVPLGFGGPLVTTVHDLIPLLHPESMPGRFKRTVFAGTTRVAVRRSDVVITVSRHAAASLYDQGFSPRSLRVIHHGIGAQFRPSEEEDVSRVRATYGLRGEYILWLGSFRPHKNVPLLIRAYAKLPEALRRRFALALGGSAESEGAESVRRLARETLGDGPGEVCFLGYVPQGDLPTLYSGASCFVFPSLHEGFGLPPLEAAACGTAVLAASRPPLTEVLGDGARFFDPLDPTDLTAELERLLGDESFRRRMAEAARRRSLRFDWDGTARETVAAYRAALRLGNRQKGDYSLSTVP